MASSLDDCVRIARGPNIARFIVAPKRPASSAFKIEDRICCNRYTACKAIDAYNWFAGSFQEGRILSHTMTIKKPDPDRQKKPRPVHYPADFGLDVLSGDDDLFRWFLLTYLLGKPIQSKVAVRTWHLFIDQKLDLPWAILKLNDRQLVNVLHRGGYTRYQHVMTKALKTSMQQLVDYYEGSLLLMIEQSESEDELSRRLQKLYGVGPRTAEIFMRETEEFFARRNE